MSDKKFPFAFLKTPVLSGLAFVFTVVTVSVGYAAWTALDRNAAATGQTVTSSLMQAVIDDVNDLNSRVSNFSFSGGNVGIGTASPSRELHIFADNYATATIETNWTAGNSVLELRNNKTTVNSGPIRSINFLQNNGSSDSQIGDHNGSVTGKSFLTFNTSASERLRIDENGNVGIGTTTPSAKLEVNGVIARTGCPTGMVSGGPFCVDSAERAAASWNAASDACYAENKHLCSVNEWSSACRRSLFSRSGNWNWTDNSHEQYWGTTYYYYTATVIGTTDCNNMNWSYTNAGTPYSYRCCADRVVGGN